MTNEISRDELLNKFWTKVYGVLENDSDHVVSRKVTGANVIFIGLGDGTTAQFEYEAPNKWHISMGEGDLND